MLAKRIIPCLDVKDGKVVKGVQFVGHEVLGDAVDLALKYRDEGADELVLYDITASAEGRVVDYAWVRDIARALDIPFCVAGGIRSSAQAVAVLNSGADKISINSPALERPDLINEIADMAGSQCVVVGIDSKQIETDFGFTNIPVIRKRSAPRAAARSIGLSKPKAGVPGKSCSTV